MVQNAMVMDPDVGGQYANVRQLVKLVINGMHNPVKQPLLIQKTVLVPDKC